MGCDSFALRAIAMSTALWTERRRKTRDDISVRSSLSEKCCLAAGMVVIQTVQITPHRSICPFRPRSNDV